MCNSKQSCYNVGSIESAADVSCSGDSSCYGVSITTINGNVTCSGSESCRYSSVGGSCKNVYCTSTRSCSDSTLSHIKKIYANGEYSAASTNISNVSFIYAYGARSLKNSQITQETGTIEVYLYGLYAGDGLFIDCQTGANCFIRCDGTGCNNVTLTCDGSCFVYCDDSHNIDCPNGYIGPTSSPSNTPTQALQYSTSTADTPLDTPTGIQIPTAFPTAKRSTTTEPVPLSSQDYGREYNETNATIANHSTKFGVDATFLSSTFVSLFVLVA